MRTIFGSGAPRDLDDAEVRTAYRWPDAGAVRANMVSTLDGSAVGADGSSGSINTPADHRVFAALRDLCDVVVVGAGTARTEGYRRPEPTAYRPAPPTLVVVSASGDVPDHLVGHDGPAGRGVLVVPATAGRPPSDDVWVCGEEDVDLPGLVERLRAEGMPRVLTEGGPGLLSDLLSAGLVDEIALTLVPRVVGDRGRHLTSRPLADEPTELVHLLEEDGTLLGLWRVGRTA